MRTPWQSFRLDLERAPIRLWAALGRLDAYGDTLAALPAAPETVAALARTWRSHAAAAAFGAAPIDPEVADAVAALYEAADRRPDAPLTPQTLCADNAALGEIAQAAGLAEPGDAGGGHLGDQLAGGKGTWTRLNQYCAWLNGPEFRPTPDEAIQTAMLQALGAHLYLLRLAPFRRCAEATAQFAGYRLLRAAGLPAMAAHLPAAHFGATRDAYTDLIVEAADPGGATFDFIAYAVAGIGGGLRDQIAALGAAQRAGAWRSAIADAFAGKTRTGDGRRRLLVETLSAADTPVRIGQLRYLSPRLAEAYAGKSAKTLSRDVKWLEAQGLVRRTLEGVRFEPDCAAPLAARAA